MSRQDAAITVGSTFEQLLEAAPDAMVGIDQTGKMLLVNGQAEKLFGYLREDLLGESVEILVPERFRSLHPGHRLTYFDEPRTRPMGAGLELFGLCHDGTEFPAEISLSSITTEGGRLGMAAIRDVTDRRAAEQRFEQLLEFAPDAIFGVGRDGAIAIVNQQAESLFGYTRSELIGMPVEKLVPSRFAERHPADRERYFENPKMRPMGAGVELSAVHKYGGEFPVEISLSSIDSGSETLAVAAVRDISERTESERERALQEQLNQAQRLESVGQLAGGVAHDFNNILGVILNYARFVGEELDPESQAFADTQEIERAAERAAALTRQLLIFSRREVAKAEVISLRDLLNDLEKLLHRALGERVALETSCADDIWPIQADPGQIEQVLVNLAVNARDAMPGGGRLHIELENAVLDDEYHYMHPDTEPGRYVRIKVSDSGQGMERDVLSRAFEPFFTTKSKGEGTGLGLATVYGIVTEAGGKIDLYSEPGMGTTVKVHIPASDAEVDGRKESDGRHSTGRGEVVLVVEDEADVRKISERILTRGSYSVITHEKPEDALTLLQDRDQQIDVLLSDVIMPGMLGTELVSKAREARPDLPVIFMSGYSHSILDPQTLDTQRGAIYLEKPFSAIQLLDAVREVIEADPRDDR